VRCGRILALDYGSKNIGLASCDELGITVQPLPSLPNTGRRYLLRRIEEAVKDHDIESLVIGLPLNMDGTSGEAVRKVRAFAEFLQSELHLPLREVDERLSTVEALEMWTRMGARQQRKYRTVDSLAAALILQRYLEES
jgi:putative Holliday junction resolvase